MQYNAHAPWNPTITYHRPKCRRCLEIDYIEAQTPPRREYCENPTVRWPRTQPQLYCDPSPSAMELTPEHQAPIRRRSPSPRRFEMLQPYPSTPSPYPVYQDPPGGYPHHYPVQRASPYQSPAQRHFMTAELSPPINHSTPRRPCPRRAGRPAGGRRDLSMMFDPDKRRRFLRSTRI